MDGIKVCGCITLLYTNSSGHRVNGTLSAHCSSYVSYLDELFITHIVLIVLNTRIITLTLNDVIIGLYKDFKRGRQRYLNDDSDA